MEILIDIPEEMWERVKDGYVPLGISKYLKNGVSLPKGHGRLIDADAIEYTHAIARCLEDGHNWNELCVTENELYDTPTIIEADTESEE